MKFPRNARIFRGQLDAAPFAAVFFLLVMFVMLASLTYTPGVHIQLPSADDLPGTDKNSVSVAIDANGRLYFEMQLIEENDLKNRLRQAVKNSVEPLTLVVEMDEAVTYKMLLHVTMLAREAGITDGHLATLPPVFASPRLQSVP
jgi:biopolymer transport protein ExbD